MKSNKKKQKTNHVYAHIIYSTFPVHIQVKEKLQS